MADGIAIDGRCLNHHEWLLTLGRWFMTDVTVMVLGQMLLPYICLFYGRCYWHVVLGRCYCQFYVEDVKPHVFQLIATSVLADVIA